MGRKTTLQLLCCLGLPGEALIQELLARLHREVASRHNAFFWLDAKADVVNVCAESPRFYELLPRYFAEHHERGDRELMGASYASLMRSPQPLADMRYMVRDDRRLERSRFYREILRPLGLHNVAYLKVRHAGRPLGMLLLGMGQAKPHLDAGERRRLVALVPLIARAVSAPQQSAAVGFQDDDLGVLVCDRAGHLRQLSARARVLLLLATHAQAGARHFTRCARESAGLPVAARRLCAHLAALGARAENGSPAAHVVSNAWGRFAFRAYRLEPLRGERALTCVVVQRQIPTALALWRRIDALHLPPKQSEVCLHLASGRSYAGAAAAMGVSVNTVAWHVRELYGRFDVHGSSELALKLLSQATPRAAL